MATIAIFPDETHSGPHIDKLNRQPLAFEPDVTKFEDGGAHVSIQLCGLRTWELEYTGLSQDDVETLRAHNTLAKGKTNDFSFYDRQTNATYTKCFYVKFDIGKAEKTWLVPVTITLGRYE